MFAGDLGIAAMVKSREKQVPLWALVLAAFFLDFIAILLGNMGIETGELRPGYTFGYGTVILHNNYTHSLLGAIAVATLFGAVAMLPWGRRAGIVLGAVVLLHWVLDAIVIPADLPLLPANIGNFPGLGIALWRLPYVAAAFELSLVAIGSYLYWRAARTAIVAAGGAGVGRANLLTLLIVAWATSFFVFDFFALM